MITLDSVKANLPASGKDRNPHLFGALKTAQDGLAAVKTLPRPSKARGTPKAAAAEGPEEDLHNAILKFCKAMGWLAFHGSMKHRTKRTLGEPDFTIVMPGGRVIFIECKTEKSDLSDKQREIAEQAARLGHTVHIIRSVAGFRALIDSLWGYCPANVELGADQLVVGERGRHGLTNED